jgi:hypothetical protein
VIVSRRASELEMDVAIELLAVVPNLASDDSAYIVLVIVVVGFDLPHGMALIPTVDKGVLLYLSERRDSDKQAADDYE